MCALGIKLLEIQCIASVGYGSFFFHRWRWRECMEYLFMRHEDLLGGLGVGDGRVDIVLSSELCVCISIDTVFDFVIQIAFNRSTSYVTVV